MDESLKAKPVMGVDDLLRVLVYHWAKDQSVFPNERQRVQLATILLFAAYTSSRPAELVDAQVSEKSKKNENNWKWRSEDDPWNDSSNTDFADGVRDTRRRSKAICYEDVCLMVLRNPDNDGRPVVAMEVTLSHHKGVDRKPKP